jgi:transglutaminase-like putative cysteine protease
VSAWAPPGAHARGLRERRAEVPRDSLGLQMAAFFALALFAALQYTTLLVHPPAGRVAAVVAIATAAGGGLSVSGRTSLPSPYSSVLRAAIVTIMLLVALLAIGIPAHLLTPDAWGALEGHIRHGLAGLRGWLWPYRGSYRWAGLTVMLVVAVVIATSAGLCFWPSPRAERTRRAAALALLVAIFLTGVANETNPAWGFQGVFLLALVACWLWLARLRPADVNRAAWWLLASAALALAAAPRLSARHSWIDYRAWNPLALTSTFQWDQLYGPFPWPRSTATMFEVAEPEPALLKVTSLDRFDGLRFLRSDAPPGLRTLDLGHTRAERRWYKHAVVTIRALNSSLLVSAGGIPVDVTWLGSAPQTIASESDGTTVLRTTPTSGAGYEVASYVPTPSVAVLRHAPRGFPRAYLPYAQFELPSASASGLVTPDLSMEERARPGRARLVGAPAPGRTPASSPSVSRRIEASPYAPMFALARGLAEGARTNYDVAERIERFLLKNYRYDENIPNRRYPLEAFLFQDRRGYCQQFSGAMALMLRLNGIPARVSAGFMASVYDPVAAAWRVRALDAHSWVEVYFTGIGWVPFDPTPPRTVNSGAGANGLTSRSIVTSDGLRGHSGAPGTGRFAPPASGVTRQRSDGASPGLLAGAALAALLMLLAAHWWMVGARRLQRALAGDAGGAVAELRNALRQTAYEVPSAVTLAKLEERLQLARKGEASRYLKALRELRYAPQSDQRPSLRQRRALRRALGEHGPLTRFRALLAMPPGMARRFDGENDCAGASVRAFARRRLRWRWRTESRPADPA